ncbi:FtsX-like permease family protein [Flavobacteriaceae bacterium R38]|nr:FtsX-like permease family protein [Flavobacteriaceae bacterium R38]
MFNRDLWSEIWHSIKNNKLRTFLTGFSVAWGIFILVLLLASVKGLENGVTRQLNDDASNAIFIYPNETSKPYGGFEAGRRIVFKNEDIEFIKNSFPGYYEYISPRFRRSVNAKYKKETGSYTVVAVKPSYRIVERTVINMGRYLNDNDIENKAKVAVIGRKVVEELFKKEDPIGKYVTFNSFVFKVIGVFSDEGNEREESNIYAPITTMQLLYGNTDEINDIAMTYNPDFNLAKAISFSDNIESNLKRKLSIDPDDQSAFFMNNSAEAFSDISNFTNVLRVMSIFIGFMILIAGIVGIGNILVFIIKERTKEIGVRKALGARPFEVVKLVLLESVFITSLSGLGGLIFAMGLVGLISPLVDAPAFSNPSVDTITVVTATVILIISGVLAGLIPALQAARVKPIVALRAD